jgi:hypothetical protein
VLVLGLVLAKGRVALEQLVEHASEAEPVGAGIVGRTFRQDFGGHVAVSTSTRQSKKNNKHEQILLVALRERNR